MHDYATGAMAAQVAMNTTLSAATGGITVFVLAYFITKKYDVGGLCNGILAGRRHQGVGAVVSLSQQSIIGLDGFLRAKVSLSVFLINLER